MGGRTVEKDQRKKKGEDEVENGREEDGYCKTVTGRGCWFRGGQGAGDREEKEEEEQSAQEQ